VECHRRCLRLHCPHSDFRHLWRHCWSIILHGWHWIVDRWGAGGVTVEVVKGFDGPTKNCLLRWKYWVVERWLMEWHVRLIPISEQLSWVNTWQTKKLLLKRFNLRRRPDMMLIVRLCSLMWHIILFWKYVLILHESIKNNKWFCNWTYIVIIRWLYRRDVVDNMVDVSLYVCWLVMQMVISIKLIFLNYTIIMVITHSYPCGRILWLISISLSSHIFFVKLIKVQWVTWNTLSKSKLTHNLMNLMKFNRCETYEELPPVQLGKTQ